MKHLKLIPMALMSVALVTACADTDNDGDADAVVTDTDTTAVAPTASTAVRPYDGTGTNTTVTVDAVPQKASASFTSTYPNVSTASWYKYRPMANDEYMDDADYYYAAYQLDGIDYYVWYDDEGNIYRTSNRMKDPSGLPAAVTTTLNAQYPGYTIDEVDEQKEDGMMMYEVKLENDKDEKVKVKIKPDGTIHKLKKTD